MEKNGIIDIEELKIDPFTLIHDILVNWWVILLGAIGAALMASVIVSSQYTPTYTTSATFVVSAKTSQDVYDSWSRTAEMAQTMQSILKSNAMNKIICKELGVEEIDAQITAETMGETNLLSLRVTADTSREAMEVIYIVMDNYTKVSYYALGNMVMDVLEEPQVPMYPTNPLNLKDVREKAFIIMALALIALFGLLSFFRDTIKTEADIEKKLDARSLGQIPFELKYKTMKEQLIRKKRALLVNNPVAGFAFVESYKKLATKVDYRMHKKEAKALVITSVSENEGKSTVAANLAISLANQSKKVILLEGDLRRPSQFLLFNKKPKETQEIGEYLKGNIPAKELLMQSNIPNLYLILGKNAYSSSTEMVQTRKMTELLEYCKKKVDYVIIDSPPIGLLGDAEVLAQEAGAVLLVAKQNMMLAEDINDMLDGFRAHQSSVIGVLLNGVMSFPKIGGDGSYGKYGRYGKYANTQRDRGKK